MPLVHYITPDPRNLHGHALLHSIDELREQAALGVLKVPQVDLDQQVHVSTVCDLRQRMIEPSLLLFLPCLLVQELCFKFQILASVMTEGASWVRQGKSVNKGISGQLILPNELDLDWFLQFLNVSLGLRVDDIIGTRIVELVNEGVLV